ncbi:hypothetical protein ACXR0O_10110 [Verrucomicrobiota bacterium sgz303538]
MLRGFLLALGLLITVTAGAKEKPEQILKSLPEAIAGFKHTGEIHTFPYAQLGAAAAYNSPEAQVTVYVYDQGVKDIPSGVAHPLVKQSFEMAKRDIRDRHNDIETLKDGETALRNGGKVLSAEYRLTFSSEDSNDLSGGDRVYSSVYLAGAREHIVKVRATAPVRHQEEIRKRASLFVDELFGILKGAGRASKGK